jgi:hypothetical protein
MAFWLKKMQNDLPICYQVISNFEVTVDIIITGLINGMLFQSFYNDVQRTYKMDVGN